MNDADDSNSMRDLIVRASVTAVISALACLLILYVSLAEVNPAVVGGVVGAVTGATTSTMTRRRKKVSS